MPDLFYLLSKWWKHITAVIVIAMILVSVVLLLKPRLYLSTTTSLPASTYSSDKASVFNENIQVLYPPMGGADDLDKIIGTSRLDTVYIAITEKMNLVDHYDVHEKGDEAGRKAASILKENTKVMKTDYGELQVKVWDREKEMAPMLANAITNKLQAMHQDIQNSHNISLIKNLESARDRIENRIDSINSYLKKVLMDEGLTGTYVTRRTALTEQLKQHEQLINEYQLMVDNKPPILVIVERARVSNKPDKPGWLPVLVGTFVLSLLFSLILTLILERKKSVQH